MAKKIIGKVKDLPIAGFLCIALWKLLKVRATFEEHDDDNGWFYILLNDERDYSTVEDFVTEQAEILAGAKLQKLDDGAKA